MFGTSIFEGSCSSISVVNLGRLEIPRNISDTFKIKCKVNEPIFIVMGHHGDDASLTILVRETDYESFYNLKKEGYNIRGFSVQAFTSYEEDLLLEQRADWMDFSPGKIGLCGGMVKHVDLKGEILRECREEIGTFGLYLQDDQCIVMPEDGVGFLCVVFLNMKCTSAPPYSGSEEGKIVQVPELSFPEYVKDNMDKLTAPLVGVMRILVGCEEGCCVQEV